MLIFIYSFLLKNKKQIFVFFLIILTFLTYQSLRNLRISNQINKTLPEVHESSKIHDQFRKKFGEDGNSFFISIPRNLLYENIYIYEAWENLRQDIENEKIIIKNNEIDPIEVIVSETNLKKLVINEEDKIFDFISFANSKPNSTKDLEKIRNEINEYPFYKGLIYSDTKKNQEKEEISLMVIQIKKEFMALEERSIWIEKILKKIENFKLKYPEIHISGLAFIRAYIKKKIQEEVLIFVSLSILMMSLILFFFFRSWKILILCLSVVSSSVLFGLGMIAFLGYEISSMMSLMPSLLIVIGIPNCIYYIHYLQDKVQKHEKKEAIKLTFLHISKISFMTNLTTALGFFTFITTKNQMLSEFGIATGISVLFLFLCSNILFTLGFQTIKIPAAKHHFLENKFQNFLKKLNIIPKKYNYYFSIALVLSLFTAIFYAKKIQTTASFTDDLSEKSILKQDLRYFERHFSGVIPIDIYIQSTEKFNKEKQFKKLEELQKKLYQNDLISKSISILDLSKYLRQAFYNGDSSDFKIIKNNEKVFFDEYLQNTKNKYINQIQQKNPLFQFIDSTQKELRIALNIKDVNSKEMKKIIDFIEENAEQTLNSEDQKNKIQLTGNAILNLLGTDLLQKNLLFSLSLSIFLIALIILFIFGSFKITFIAIIINLIPLIFTAGLMGFLDIPLKPSTLLIFSIVFGISIDDSIHYLGKFKLNQGLGLISKNLIETTTLETGKSMITTSLILFLGFSVFAFSDFGSTTVLGILVSFTLLIALICNLIILPYLLKKTKI